MILKLPENLQGKDLLQYLHANKATLTKQKRIGQGEAGAVGFAESKGACLLPQQKAVKMEHEGDKAIIVDVVANLTGWMDTQNDVLLRGCFAKSLADKGNDFPFLRDHSYVTDCIIAETMQVYTQDFAPAELGISTRASVAPQALMFRGRLTPDLSGKTYYQYKAGLIKQHSIGLRYVRLELAMNDPQFEQEYKAWLAYSPQVLNIDKAIETGYFWAVSEIALIENSAVVFGANSQTPTISVEEEKAAAEGTAKEKVLAVNDTDQKKNFVDFYSTFK